MVRRRVASEKRTMAVGLRQCIRPLVESLTPGHDGAARPRPYNVDGLVRTFSDSRFRERGRDPLPSLFSASRPGRNSFSLNRDFMQTQQERECDSVGSGIRPPRPCEPICWPKPRRQPSDECASTVVLTNYSERALVCVAVAVRCVRLEQRVFVSTYCRVC